MRSAKADKSRKDLVIAISGHHGSGKSTQAKRLAVSLGLRYISAGTIFRCMAEERGVSLEEMSKVAASDPEFDKQIDARTREESLKPGVVIEATLSAWMAVNPDIRILLTAPLESRIGRIAKRDSVPFEEAKRMTLAREKSERERFKRYYGIDISDVTIFDVVLNTELFSLDGTARILKKIVDEYC